MRLNFKQVRKENLKFLISDAIILLLLPILTAYLRFDGQELNLYTSYLEIWTPVLAIISLAVLVLSGTYRRMWLYAGLSDFVDIMKAIAISTAISFFLLLAMKVQIPESFFLTEFLLGCILLSATRLTGQFEKFVRKENLKFFIVDAVIVMVVPFLTVQKFFSAEEASLFLIYVDSWYITLAVATLIIFSLFGIARPKFFIWR